MIYELNAKKRRLMRKTKAELVDTVILSCDQLKTKQNKIDLLSVENFKLKSLFLLFGGLIVCISLFLLIIN